jgi:hypothetical protein
MEWTTKYHFGWFVALFGTNLKPWVFFNKHWASDFSNLIIRRDTNWLVSKDQKLVWTNLEDSRNRSTWPMFKKKHLNFGSLVVGLFACHSGSPCMKCMSFSKIPCVHFFGSAAPPMIDRFANPFNSRYVHKAIGILGSPTLECFIH